MDKLGNQIEQFLAAPAIAVAGVSDNPHKFGHKVFRCYLSHNRKAFAINPNEAKVLGHTVYKNIAALPERVESLSIITPPAVTAKIVDEAINLGVKNIWMQPGAEHEGAIQKAEAAGLNVIHGGPCVLVVLGTMD